MKGEREGEGKWITHWDQFSEELQNKLQRGFEEYGDQSFSLPPGQLLAEIQGECLDIAGWGMILWVRLEEIKRALKESPE